MGDGRRCTTMPRCARLVAMETATAEKRVSIETLKLLVSAAWADHDIAPEEVDYILMLARQTAASEQEVELLRRSLEDEARLPAPDMDLLRRHRQLTLQAVEQLIAIDHRIVADEVAMLEAVRKLLGDRD